jgi:hypothetical protein
MIFKVVVGVARERPVALMHTGRSKQHRRRSPVFILEMVTPARRWRGTVLGVAMIAAACGCLACRLGIWFYVDKGSG